ncbi:hypothetical protein Bhyg_01334, partial [Pseudolycoriella hygida]
MQNDVNKIWNDVKNKPNLTDLITSQIKELNHFAFKRQVAIKRFWNKANERKETLTNEENNINVNSTITNISEAEDNLSSTAIVDQEKFQPCNLNSTSLSGVCHKSKEKSPTPVVSIESTSVEVKERETKSEAKRSTPAQDNLKAECTVLLSDIEALNKRRNLDLISDDMTKELRLKKKMNRQRKFRLHKKNIFAKACEDDPNLKRKLKIRETVGRPRIEFDQPLLLTAIIDLALQGSAAHERRRDDAIRTVKTLDDLVQKLHEDYGLILSRSATYLRLLPRRSNSIHGKRHVITVPVKLIKTSNDMHRQHKDSKFAMTTINHINELASILGPNEVTFVSQDDKAKIPIGLPAANKQGPLLMHMEYRVKLPDHDFVIAKGHKLTPSVYAFCEIKPNGGGDASAITYSGPTYISIRSSKHSSSTATSHGRDIEKIYATPDFDKFTKTKSLDAKPVLIAIVDGGPDENPRYEKVIQMHVHHFQKYDLDAVFVACNAPGRSAFNRVERRMAPLSRSVVGIILPHDRFGTHLDNQGKTIDADLEKKNFSYAGKALAEVWSETVIDGYVTVAEYVHPEDSNMKQSSLLIKDVNWHDRHVFQSQYLLQILKCLDSACCKPRRSSVFNFIPANGLPPISPPISIRQTDVGLKLANIEEVE